MPARPTRYNRQSRAIDQKSDSLKNKVVTKQTESKIQEARRNQQEKIEQREQERQEVVIQQEETKPIQSTSIITGQKFEQDQIGVVDDADDYKTAADVEIPEYLEAFSPLIRGAVATGRGILAPTEQITQPVVDIASGVKAQDQAMPSTWLDLLITPIAAPLMMQKDFGFTEKDWYSPLGQVELWNRNESLPEFAQDTGDKRDFWTGMSDNLNILQTVLPDPTYHTLVNEGSFDSETGAMITPGYKQVMEVELPVSYTHLTLPTILLV